MSVLSKFCPFDSEKSEWTTAERIELAAWKIEELKREGKNPVLLTIAKFYNIPPSSLWHRINGRKSRDEIAEHRQFLPKGAEDALENWCQEMDDFCFPPRINLLKEMAIDLKHQIDPEWEEDKIGMNWHLRFLERLPDLDAKYTRQIEQSRTTAQQNYFSLSKFYERFRAAIEKYEISPGNLYNVDEIGFLLGMVQSVKVITSKLREGGALLNHPGNREMITVLETISGDNTFLDPMIIFKGDSIDEGWIENSEFSIPDGVMVGHSPNGWTDNEKALAYLERFFGPESETAKKAGGAYRLLLFDGHSSHVSWQFLRYCLAHKVIPFCLPSHTSHKLQPLDVAVFSPLKRQYSNAIMERCKFGDHGVMKDTFWPLFQQARTAAFTPTNIASGFRATGLYPLDPLRVLSKMPGYDSYRPSTPQNTHIGSSSPPTVYDPVDQSVKTPTTMHTIKEVQDFLLDNIHRNTPRSKAAREAARALAHSAMYSMSQNHLQQEISRQKRQIVADRVLHRKKRRKRFTLENGTINVKDLRKMVHSTYTENVKKAEKSLEHFQNRQKNAEQKLRQENTLMEKAKSHELEPGPPKKRGRYRTVSSIEKSIFEWERKLSKYKQQVKDKTAELGGLREEENQALRQVEDVDSGSSSCSDGE